MVYPVGRCVFHAWMLGLLGALSATAWFLLLTGHHAAPDQPWRWAMSLTAIGSFGAWACAAVLSWVRSPQGMLVWDASLRQDEDEVERGAWLWRNKVRAQDTPLRELQLVLDLQDRVLLHMRMANASARWIWAERSRDPARWSDLRRALVSSGT
ncbi:hypothetical protein [Hydrogenophaga sp.]|uniref:hypothetical protein n=1 Tax=Hydrogenophaga sp. TaxID=1904254 RepID=UPI002730D48C|nr:hypothetical protein [Hydrogenophaga sp.]MDP1683964.1 hypothetical protein [Hydrogenophaga sp.]